VSEEQVGREALIRALRQRLEGLARAGVDRIPVPKGALLATLAATPAPAPVGTRAPSPSPPPARVEPAAPVPPATPPRPAPPAAPAPARPAVAVAPASLFGDPVIEAPALAAGERPAALAALAAEVAGCTRCPHLASTRTQTVFGVGSPTARLMFIGEAPGADEDRTGEPFVGRAGGLLTDMITKGMGLARSDVYIANILKSRPPNNRDPLPDEVAHCRPYLERQIEIIRPEFLCLLGRIAGQTLLETALPMGKLRGRWHRYRGIPTLVTYHPAALLRNPAWKRDTWEDLQMLMRAMGLKPPERKKPAEG
jgi:DNA polymerase